VNPFFPPFFASLGASCAVTKVLHAISPPSAKAAIKLSLLILYCPVLFIGLFAAHRFTRWRTDRSLHGKRRRARELVTFFRLNPIHAGSSQV
jgi:hypothetical protein